MKTFEKQISCTVMQVHVFYKSEVEWHKAL